MKTRKKTIRYSRNRSYIRNDFNNSTDDYVFNALPGGSRNHVSASGDRTDGLSGNEQPHSHQEYIEYYNFGIAGHWWVDYQYGKRSIVTEQVGVNRAGCSASELFSVRCVQE